MPLVLPTIESEPLLTAPRCLLLYGLPKIGKTTVLSLLKNCLIIDAEGGTDFLKSLKINVIGLRPPIETEEQREARYAGILNKEGNLYYPLYLTEVIKELRKSNPYMFLAFDTLSTLEDWCEEDSRTDYMNSTIGKSFNRYSKEEVAAAGPNGGIVEGQLKPRNKWKSILELPDGAGYLYFRNNVRKWLEYLKELNSYLILTAHLKYLVRKDKAGTETQVKDLDLTGKVRGMVAGQIADSIGFIYRRGEQLWVSFEPAEEVLAGNRVSRVEGRQILLSEKQENGEVKAFWKEIYPMLA